MASSKRKVDFSGVSEEIRSGGKSRHIPAGDYLLKIVSAEWREGKQADYINWRFQVVSADEKGATLYANTSLSRDALWNLRNLIFAATGKNVAGKAVNFDPQMLIGKVVTSTVEDDEYKPKDGGESKLRSVPVDFRARDEFEEPTTEEEEDEDTETETEDDDDDLEDVEVEDL